MRFTGQVSGLAFGGIEADGPVSLLRKVDPTAIEEDSLRCWILIKGGAGENKEDLWAEVYLNIKGYFSSIRAFAPNPDHIQIHFRTKNSDPSSILLEQDITASLTLEESISEDDSGAADSAATTTSDEKTLAPNHWSPQVQNWNDPITGKAVESHDDPFHLVFYAKRLQSEGTKSLCVSKSGLEAYIACALNDGKDVFSLKVAQNVMCIDERKRSFSLTPTIWANSLLPHSRTLSQLFLKASEISLQRGEQLSSLDEDQDLHNRVQFWLSDMLSFHEKALKRLTYHSRKEGSVHDIPPFMSSFFFDAAEARNLGNFIMPNGTTIRDNLHTFARLTAERYSYNLAITLCSAFGVEARFHMDTSFQRTKAHWVKRRREELGCCSEY